MRVGLRHMHVSPTPSKSFPSCDVTCAISEPRPSAILSYRESKVASSRGPGNEAKQKLHVCLHTGPGIY